MCFFVFLFFLSCLGISWSNLLSKCVYLFKDSIPVHNALFGEGIGSILLDNLMCNSSENTLLDCLDSDNYIGLHNCDHSEDAGVKCEGE